MNHMYAIPADVVQGQLQQSCYMLHWQITEVELSEKEVATTAAAVSSPAAALEEEAQAPCALMPAHHHWLHASYSSSVEFAVKSRLLHSNTHNINAINI